MTGAERVVRLVSAVLPRSVRARYREELLADLAGAREAGVATGGIVAGALALVFSIDRADPRVSGMPVTALAARRARWGAAFLGVAAVLAFGLFLSGGWTSYRVQAYAGLAVFDVIAGAAQLVVLAAVLVGFVLVVAALAAVFPVRGPAAVLLAVIVGLVVAATGGVFVASALGVLLVLPLLGVAGIVAGFFLRPAPHPARGRRFAEAAAALVSSGAIAAVAVLGVLHVTIWNPLAKLPGMTLDEIYAGLAAANELPSRIPLVFWVGCAAIAAILIAVFGLAPARRLRAARSPRRILVLGLVGIAGTAFSVWLAGFGMGMGIADAFMTGGGDAAVTGPLLTALGVVAGVPAVLLVAVPGRRSAAVASR